jgi:hypothetical protein
MVTIEQDKDHCSSRREEKQTILGKGIGMETPSTIFDSDLDHVSEYR